MTKAISKREETAIAKPIVPMGRGFEEGVDQDELIIPRAKLLQPVSEEVQDNEAGLRPGQIINSLTKELLPEVFVPVFKYTEWLRFNPRKKDDPGFDPAFDPGALIWRSNDPNDLRVLSEGKFGENGEPPLAMQVMNFFSFFPGVPMPVVIGFSRTSFKAGKQLLSLARFAGGDLFARKYRLGAKSVKGDQGNYFVLTVAFAELALPEEAGQGETLWNDFAKKDFKTDDSAVAEAEVTEEAPF